MSGTFEAAEEMVAQLRRTMLVWLLCIGGARAQTEVLPLPVVPQAAPPAYDAFNPFANRDGLTADPAVASDGMPYQDRSPTYRLPSRGTTFSPWSAGIAVNIVAPYFSNSAAYITTTGVGGPAPTSTPTDFQWDLAAAPEVWIGYLTPSGRQWVARCFFFDQRSKAATTTVTNDVPATTTVAPPASVPSSAAVPFGAPGVIAQSGVALPSDLLTFSSQLRVTVIDLEGEVWQRTGERGRLQMTAGLRYLYLSQTYNGLLTNSGFDFNAFPVGEIDTLEYGHNYSGGGPTWGLKYARPLPRRGWTLNASARGSVTVGRSRQRLLVTQAIDDFYGDLGGPFDPVSASSESAFTSVIPGLDGEGGFSYENVLPDLRRTMASVYLGAVSQTYFNAGTAAATSGNLTLFGLRIAGQLRF